MGGQILVPNPVNMGQTLAATPITVVIYILNVSTTSSLDITGLSFSDPQFTAPGFVPTILPPYEGLSSASSLQVSVTFTPTGGPGAPVYATGTFTSSASQGSPTFSIYAQVTTLAVKTLDVDSTHYGTTNFGVIKVGVEATMGVDQIHILNNGSSLPRIVSIVADTTDGFEVVNISQTLPYTLTGPGDYVSFQITLTPTEVGIQFFPAAVVITFDNGASPEYTANHTVNYQGYLIIPAFSLGNTIQAMLVAFQAAGGGVALLQVNPIDLNCEEPAYVTQQLDFDEPGQVKNVERYLIRYERLGQSTLTITASANSPANQPAVTQTVITSTSTDGTIDQLLVDGSIAAEILQLKLSRLALAGPLSITLYQPYIDIRGEKIEAT